MLQVVLWPYFYVNICADTNNAIKIMKQNPHLSLAPFLKGKVPESALLYQLRCEELWLSK